jgi:transcriptional regulator GlxA family with amidase domain
MAKKIAFLCFERFQALDLSGPMEVFYQSQVQGGCRYDISLLSVEGGAVCASNGMSVNTECLSNLDDLDALLVVGGLGVEDAILDKTFLRFIRRQSAQVNRLISICSGSLALAAAGVLKNKQATSHWKYTHRLHQLDSTIDVKPDAIYVEDGRVFTSAGVTAGLDLALAIVERDNSKQVAMAIAKNLVMPYRRAGGQSQFSEKLRAQQTQESVFSELCHYIQNNLQADLKVESLAQWCAMSARNFSRRFTEQLKCAPGQYVEFARIEKAKELLSEGEIALKTVAHECGYDSIDVFRRAFRRSAGVSAVEFRKSFGA